MNIFEKAKKEKTVDPVLVFEARAGERIDDYAERLIGHFREVQKRVLFVVAIAGEDKKNPLTIYGKFNDVDLSVTSDSTAASIVKDFHDGFAENQRKYEESDEYKQKQKERQAEAIRLNAECQHLMNILPSLNFSDVEAVVKWFIDYIPLTDHIDVRTPVSEVVSIMNKNVYEPSANTGDDFIEDDKENHARWLIGYTLAAFDGSGIVNPRIIFNFENWVQKFCKKA